MCLLLLSQHEVAVRGKIELNFPGRQSPMICFKVKVTKCQQNTQFDKDE